MEQNACPETLIQAVRFFEDKDVAHEFAASIIYPNGVCCPRCGGVDPSFYRNRRVYRCSQCKKQFSLKVGTIFEDSPLDLDKWLVAMWQIANCKNGVSSWELHRALGVTQKTAWFMLHRIRLALLGNVYRSVGTFTGRLEAVNLHTNPCSAYIYPLLGPSKVRCTFAKGKFPDIGEYLGRHVEVSGFLMFRKDEPHPFALDADTITPLMPDETRPPATKLIGLMPNLTGGIDVLEYLHDLRHEATT